MDTQSLSGKVALVTGGSRGIGAAIATRLSREGAAVAITYSNSRSKADEVVQAIESAGGKALAIAADAANAEAVRGAVEQTVQALGRIDVLVNNAGIAIMAPVDQMKLEDFDRIFAVNVRAVFVATQAAARHMTDGGRIITIGSCNADRIQFVGGAAYAMSKAAVAAMTRGLARDLGPRGITVNTIQPGPTDTEMNPSNGPASQWLVDQMAVKRYGRAEEVAAMVAYLAGPETGIITGAALSVDGGINA